MSPPSRPLRVAMPVGMPAAGANVADYYQGLGQATMVRTDTPGTVSVWISDDAQYTGLFAMVKGALRFVPQGQAGPDGQAVAAPAMVLKIWFWEYLTLRKCAAPGQSLPKLIVYGHVDPATVRSAIGQAIESEPRNATRTAVEKTAMADAFMNGQSAMLVSGGTPIGRGLADTSSTAPVTGGRRVDLSFRHRNGTAASPVDMFDMWGTLLGPSFDAHPLLGAVRGPIVPSAAPLEGGLRVRIKVTGFVAGSAADVDGAAVGELTPSADGKVLYGTLPPATAGTHDLTITPPGGGPGVVSGTVTYVIDVVATTRAVMASQSVRMEELRDRIKQLQSEGALDSSQWAAIAAALADFQWMPWDQIVTRSIAGGGSFLDPSVGDTADAAASRLGPLAIEIYELLGSSAPETSA